MFLYFNLEFSIDSNTLPYEGMTDFSIIIRNISGNLFMDRVY